MYTPKFHLVLVWGYWAKDLKRDRLHFFSEARIKS